MKKVLLAAIAMGLVLPAAAQDTYESARLLGSDLNGTARYVGMGGAMEALGADISTMGTNPAGIGLFRHSTASLSFGVVSQADAKEFDGLNKTNMSFDQAGFVYSARVSPTSFINVGFNYHKSKNFDQILSAANSLRGCSQNGLTYEKAARGLYEFDENKQGEVMGWEGDYRSYRYNQADYMNANVFLLDPDDQYFYWSEAGAYSFDRAHRGWIADYDFNLSGNYNDRFFWGLTVGVQDVHAVVGRADVVAPLLVAFGDVEHRVRLLIAGCVIRQVQTQKHCLFAALVGLVDQLDNLFVSDSRLRQNNQLIRFGQSQLQICVFRCKVCIAHRRYL